MRTQMSSPEQRSAWYRLAAFVVQLGLDPEEGLPVDWGEVLADAVLGLVAEVDRLHNQLELWRHADDLRNQQLQRLALRVSGQTGEPWENVLGSVGVEPQSPRDPGPSEVVLAEDPTEMSWRDHDHTAEHAVLYAFEDPTPDNQRVAEVAVALLQRRYDHVLRRLDGGNGEVPPFPSHRHNSADHPQDCLEAVLQELAGSASLNDRAETLAHGLEAAHALEQQVKEARGWARGHEHGLFTVDTDDPPEWLTDPLAPEG